MFLLCRRLARRPSRRHRPGHHKELMYLRQAGLRRSQLRPRRHKDGSRLGSSRHQDGLRLRRRSGVVNRLERNQKSNRLRVGRKGHRLARADGNLRSRPQARGSLARVSHRRNRDGALNPMPTRRNRRRLRVGRVNQVTRVRVRRIRVSNRLQDGRQVVLSSHRVGPRAGCRQVRRTQQDHRLWDLLDLRGGNHSRAVSNPGGHNLPRAGSRERNRRLRAGKGVRPEGRVSRRPRAGSNLRELHGNRDRRSPGRPRD